MRMKKIMAFTAALALSAGAAAVTSSAEAEANTINGCTSQYYNTRFSSKCWPAQVSANYQTKGFCKAQVDRWAGSQYVRKNYYLNGVSSGECRFKVTGARTYAF